MKIIIADDHKIIRDGLRALLEKQPDMKVVAETMDGRSTLELARRLTPCMVIMDVNMPDLNGIEATRRITREIPGVQVVALSMHADRRFVKEMFKAGAQGYLLKDCAFEELLQALRIVAEGQFYLSPTITGIVIQDFVEDVQARDHSAFTLLTAREREVLQLLAEGKTTAQMAAALFVSEKTIETHRRQVMQKLNLHSIAELTKYAIRQGITTI